MGEIKQTGKRYAEMMSNDSLAYVYVKIGAVPL